MSYPGLRYLAEGRLGLLAPPNHDLVVNPAPLAVAGARHLTYHGGPTIPSPKLYLVQVGNWWGDLGRLEAFASDLMTAGYLQPLADLGYGSGQGTYAGLYRIPSFGGAQVADTRIQSALLDALHKGQLPAADDNSLYALLFPDGVSVVFDGDGSGSCTSWCGYHSNTATAPTVYYSVQTTTQCDACNGGHDPFDAFCMVLAHEVAEACTDPTGQGWYDNSDGSENADIEAWIALTWGPWTVQGYYTNERGNTVGDYQQTPPPPPEPGPDDWRRVALTAIDEAVAKYHVRLTGARLSAGAKAINQFRAAMGAES